MMTNQERIRALHERAARMKKKTEQSALRFWGSMTAVLAAAFVTATGMFAGTPHSAAGGSFAGASMLGDSAGGYVLTGVLAFAVAVVITVICMRSRYRREVRGNPDKRPDHEPERDHTGDEGMETGRIENSTERKRGKP